MQARSGTVRGAPPRAREGGGGSSGWMRAHNAVGEEAIGEGGHDDGSSHNQPNQRLSPD
jgi:hypothetical protein